tara:strand:+ start:907 stop:2091 length:1185 start_codon:yes stop_codon:yes gene_type:complete
MQAVINSPSVYMDLAKVFNVNGKEYAYTPNLIKTIQTNIPEIDVDIHNTTSKLDIIYELFLQHIHKLFSNSDSQLFIQSPLSTSVRKQVCVNYMDLFILPNSNEHINDKYIQQLKKIEQQRDIADIDPSHLHLYAIFCNHFNINVSDVPRIISMLTISITNDKKFIIFYRKNGIYDKFLSIKNSTDKSIHSTIIFKIYVNGQVCCLTYVVKSNTLEFLYTRYKDQPASELAFDLQVMQILSTTIFKEDFQFVSLNIKNLDDRQFEHHYEFIRDIKIWVCICLSFFAPQINIRNIVGYINSLPYLLRDSFYSNLILFIFKHSGHMAGQPHDFSGLISDLLSEQRLKYTGGISMDTPIEHAELSKKTVQAGGSLTDINTYAKTKTVQIIRNLFTID